MTWKTIAQSQTSTSSQKFLKELLLHSLLTIYRLIILTDPSNLPKKPIIQLNLPYSRSKTTYPSTLLKGKPLHSYFSTSQRPLTLSITPCFLKDYRLILAFTEHHSNGSDLIFLTVINLSRSLTPSLLTDSCHMEFPKDLSLDQSSLLYTPHLSATSYPLIPPFNTTSMPMTHSCTFPSHILARNLPLNNCPHAYLQYSPGWTSAN